MTVVVFRDAPSIWNALKGIICIYKPAGVCSEHLRNNFTSKIASELCEMQCRPPNKHVVITGDDTSKKLTVMVKTNYADHPLVVGERYRAEDLKCSWASFLGKNTSGVQIFGLRSGVKEAKKLHNLFPIRTYRVRGQLGYSTDTLFSDGKVVERAKYNRISRTMIDRWCATIQASHQTKMFEMSGVDIQSQAAYELAVKGLLRPNKNDIPVIYGLKCVVFKPPDFTIEIQCINEYEEYFMKLIHEIGYKLHSAATCIQIQCIRHAVFSLEDALLRKHWTLQFVIENLQHCNRKLEKYKDALESPHLVDISNYNNNDTGNSERNNTVYNTNSYLNKVGIKE